MKKRKRVVQDHDVWIDTLIAFGIGAVLVLMVVHFSSCGTLTPEQVEQGKDLFDRIYGMDGIDDGEEGTTTDGTDSADAGDGKFPAGVKWLHGSVEGWPVTTRLEAGVQGGELRLAYDKAGVWPALRQRARDGGAMNANVWVLVDQGGTLYAGVWDYLRVGQQGKPVSAVRGTDGHLPGPLSGWVPKSGDRLGFMVSGDRRGGEQNVKERSNVSWVVWP